MRVCNRKRSVLVLGVVMGILSLFMGVSPVSAERVRCFLVSNAGVAEVNGEYQLLGRRNNRPVYKHRREAFYISYDAFGYGGEWNLTNEVGGGLDLYFFPSMSQDVPVGRWRHGLRGRYPGPNVEEIPCGGEDAMTAVVDLNFYKTALGALGGVGVYTPASFTDGSLIFRKIPPEQAPRSDDHTLHSRAVEVTIQGQSGQVYRKFKGLLYVFFNLDPKTASLWQDGQLRILKFYRYRWIELPTFYVDAGSYGRVTALMYGPGVFVLGTPDEVQQP